MYAMWVQDRNAGFTIVELLIVIIIIGILSTLVNNTYKGIQNRARNARTITNVRQFYSAVKSYQASSGSYPYAMIPPEDFASVHMVCIGLGYQNGKCGKITGKTVPESQFLYDQLKAENIGIATDVINVVSGNVAGESFTGAAYGIDLVTGGGYGRTIQWFLEGSNADCSVASSYAYNTASGNTACEIILERL